MDNTTPILFVFLVKDPDEGTYHLMVENHEGQYFLHNWSLDYQTASGIYDQILDSQLIDLQHWKHIPAAAKHFFEFIL